jgi:hypothetical protein
VPKEAQGCVARRTVIRKERLLAMPGEVLVEVGQTVQPDTVVARTQELPGEPYVVDLKAEFHTRLAPEEVDLACLKKIGDRVTAGETIARRARGAIGEILSVRCPVNGTVEFISRSSARILVREDPRSAEHVVIVAAAKDIDVWPPSLRMYMRFKEGDEVHQGSVIAASPRGLDSFDIAYSPVAGFIEKVCTRTGTVTIIRPVKETEVDAYLPGVVTEIVPDLGVVVTSTGIVIRGVFGIGFENYGPLMVIARDASDEVDEDRITPECAGKVLVTGAYVSEKALRRAADVGVRGIISGGADSLDLVRLIGMEIGVGITGQEDIPLTVVLTEGFGRMSMAAPVFALLSAGAGRIVSLNGSTQLRAGVIRPEVIIADDPGQATDRGYDALGAGGDAQTASGLVEGAGESTAGRRARVVAKPYFGAWGYVEGPPEQDSTLESGITATTVVVRLDDGRAVRVAKNNIEVQDG